jgi:hypothetical protein
VCGREGFDLSLRYRVNPTLWFRRTVPQRDRQAATGLKERNQLAKGASAIDRCNVHPNRAQQDKVERQAKVDDPTEAGQSVHHPSYCRRRMQTLAFSVHPGRRLDGDDLETA